MLLFVFGTLALVGGFDEGFPNILLGAAGLVEFLADAAVKLGAGMAGQTDDSPGERKGDIFS